MQIKMLSSMPITIDGVTTVDAEKGDELVVGDGVGADLVEAGHAESLEPERKDDAPELENKDAGDADENNASSSSTAAADADSDAGHG